MKESRTLLCLVVLTFIFGCQPSPTADEVKKFINSQNTKLVQWYAEGLIDSVANVFTEDTWQMPPNSKPLVGREALRSFWKQAVQWGKWEFTLSAQSVEVGGSIASERGTFTLTFTPGPNAPQGMSAFADTGNYLCLWRKQNRVWRIAVDAPVSELPLPTPTSDSRKK
jgi:ketosteroid isomerase-like protein